MIISNLDALLKDRRLKISKVSADTGISRTTLTALCNNTGKGIQFDTANALCIYLNIGIEDLFTFLPFDLAVIGSTFLENLTPMDWSIVFHLKYTGRKGVEFPNLLSTIDVQHYQFSPSGDGEDFVEISINPLQDNCEIAGENGNSERENEIIRSVFTAMPPVAKQIFKDRIGREAIRNTSYSNYYVNLPAELESPK